MFQRLKTFKSVFKKKKKKIKVSLNYKTKTE